MSRAADVAGADAPAPSGLLPVSRLRLAFTATDHVSLAYQANGIPVIREIVIANDTEANLVDLRLRVESQPPVVSPLTLRIGRVAAGSSHRVETPDLHLDAGLLAACTKAGPLALTMILEDAEGERGRAVAEIRLLPPAHWGGARNAPELLAAFVRPGDPAVDAVLRDAARKLGAAGRQTALDGYGSGGKVRAWDLAGALWAALADHRLASILPPARFEQAGQTVRAPGEVIEGRAGTCLDLSLLYAACLEQAGLNPVLVLTAGHAFVGLWLQDETFASATVDDRQHLRKLRDLQDLILVETTLLTHDPPTAFRTAVDHGAGLVEDNAAGGLDVALDIRRCRRRGICPMDFGGRGGEAAPGPVEPLDQALSEAPAFDRVETPHVDAAPETAVGRLERWKRKLLDLSLRNKLLNFKPGKGAIVLDGIEPGALEDGLAAGHAFRLMPVSDGPVGSEGALARKEIPTTATEADLDGRLLDLYRLARGGFEEGGANILFLAIGFLSWTRKAGEATHRAPLLLIPVTLRRASVRTGFRLALHDDEVRINPTLLEMLRQDFRLRMPDLEGDLPHDASGIDVDAIVRSVRGHTRDLRGWEVVPDMVLATFSFTKHLMWKDLVDQAGRLTRNPVVRHLLETPKHAYGEGAPFPDPSQLDRDHPPETVFAPLSADSSQLSAVLAAAGGKDFVLFGPPGTGKSQTIANMIAQCLAQGRTVLFVSQKTAALEVVQRRLQEIGLGDYCLEVHATKAQKSAVLGQLRRAWHARAAPEQAEWPGATRALASLRAELNGLVQALHRRRENGLTAYEAFGRVIAAGPDVEHFVLAWPDHRTHEPDTLVALRAACRDLRPVLASVGPPADHPLQGVRATEWSPVWRDGLGAEIAAAVESLTALRASGRAFAAAVGLSAFPSTEAEIRGLLDLGNALIRPEAACGGTFLADSAGDLRRAVAARDRFQATRAALRGRLTRAYRPGLLDQDLSGLLAEWIAARGANFFVRGGRMRKVLLQVRPYADGALPEDLGPDLAGLIELARHGQAAQPEEETLGQLGPPWSDPEGAARDFGPAIAWAETVAQLLPLLGPSSLGPEGLRDHVVRLVTQSSRSREAGGPLAQAYAAFAQDHARTCAAMTALSHRAGSVNPETLPAAQADWIGANLALARRWASGLGRAQGWCAWQGAAQAARDLGLGPLIEALEAGRIKPDRAEVAFEIAYARWWIDRVVGDDPVLRGFLPERHEDAIARFRAADAQVGDLARQVVRARLGSGIPGPTAFGNDPEWGTLSHELTKKRAQIPLRKLFGTMPNALARLTPCVMMSPLSIAQYLPPDGASFDIVIFDEASQIAPWDAIGAMARGRQVVIVGDPEQLPPTSVGDRAIDDMEDDGEIADQESILDACLAANLPRRTLDWHYRSRHESLIAFSNARYYGGRLVTFPSPVTEDRAVRLTFVPDGVYERGTGRVNRPEAHAVVADIVRRLRDPDFARARRSLGIVTFNGEQQQLIENLLDAERRSDPELEPYFDRDRWHELVFVKNLETVQGDERDVILFSVAVGPDPGGRTVSTVSSLNKDGGHRRLNVAITRARQELVVFASIRPEQIDLGRTRARGVRDFKHFLEFADRGARALAEACAPTGGAVESPFEAAVLAGLRAQGWTVHVQIGVSGFRIDLGIVHPDAPGRYLAGIECDGATYHRSATARDRDRLREHVLTDLGWRIRRVWSTAWWADAAGALAELDRRLREDLETDRAKAAEATAASDPRDAPAPDAPILTEPADQATAAAMTGVPSPTPLAEPDDAMTAQRRDVGLPSACAPPPISTMPPDPAYRLADPSDIGLALEPERFYDTAYRPVLAALVVHVVTMEGPIYEDVLLRRVARAHGLQRVGPLIREMILDQVPVSVARSDDDGRVILWPPHAEPRARHPYRVAPAGLRSHADTPMPELVDLAGSVAPGTSEPEGTRLMGQAIGLSRVEAATRVRFARARESAGEAGLPHGGPPEA